MKLYKYLSLVAVGLLLWNCQPNEVATYDGPSQIHFIESRGSMIIDGNNPEYNIKVGVNRAVDTDRIFTVVIDEENTSSVEGVDFEFVNKEITIAAGEVLGEVTIKGIFEGAEPLGTQLSLRLNSSISNEVAEYSNEYTLQLYKFCDFDRDAFIGTYMVYEHSTYGEFEYTAKVTAGDDPYSVYIDGFWDVSGSKVEIRFDRKATNCNIPSQFFYFDGSYEPQYQNFWLRSTSPGIYNSCLGSIEGMAYHVYPQDMLNSYWDYGTFDMYKITD
nr:hypothetical protein [uncultured Carboxylicivirga sp.]